MKILLDHTYLYALIHNEDENHQMADKIANILRDDDVLYIPNNELMTLMNRNKEFYQENKIIYKNLKETSRINQLFDKKIYIEAEQIYQNSDNLDYNNCITLVYMKQKKIRYILSFNQKLDTVRGIKRVYKIDKNNKSRLDYYSWKIIEL